MKKTLRAMPCRRIIREMINGSGMSASEVSRSMGRSSGYLNTMLSSGSIPGVDTFSEIAHACGYEVVVESPYHTERFGLMDQRQTKKWLDSAIKNMDASATPEQRRSEAFKKTRATFYRDAGEKTPSDNPECVPPGTPDVPTDHLPEWDSVPTESDFKDLYNYIDGLAEQEDNPTE